jgi:hypothetical protein
MSYGTENFFLCASVPLWLKVPFAVKVSQGLSSPVKVGQGWSRLVKVGQTNFFEGDSEHVNEDEGINLRNHHPT